VRFEVVGDAPALTADRHLVQRAITNLAQNGADACLESGRGGRVTIEVTDSVEGPFVEFRVKDEGKGIAPDRIPALLKSDFRSTKRANGVGLGLGVVRQVAESHRGRLELSSQVGEGSTFSLVLPKEGPSHAQEGRAE
jgi:two-component system phosphate regulon sensor histidine kinase PhoR